MTNLASPASRRQTPCSMMHLQLPWVFLPQKRIRLGQLLTRRRSLSEREHRAYVQWLGVGSRWLSNTSSQEREAGQPGLATYLWGFKGRPTKLFVSRGLSDIGGSLRPLQSSQKALQGSEISDEVVARGCQQGPRDTRSAGNHRKVLCCPALASSSAAAAGARSWWQRCSKSGRDADQQEKTRVPACPFHLH